HNNSIFFEKIKKMYKIIIKNECFTENKEIIMNNLTPNRRLVDNNMGNMYDFNDVEESKPNFEAFWDLPVNSKQINEFDNQNNRQLNEIKRNIIEAKGITRESNNLVKYKDSTEATIPKRKHS